MYGVCAGTKKTAGRGGEDPTGRTTKEATGNSTIVTMLMLDPVLLESSKVRCNTRTNELLRDIISTVVLKSLLISQERELKRQQAVMLKEQVSSCLKTNHSLPIVSSL